MKHQLKIVQTDRVPGSNSERAGEGPAFYYSCFKSPIGTLYVASVLESICKISLGISCERDFNDFFSKYSSCKPVRSDSKIRLFKEAILAYLEEGKNLPPRSLMILRATKFQFSVWNAALIIPYGETRPYGWVAERIKNPEACRAVGSALGENPIPLFIPCHRVVRSDGSMGGFTGGIKIKKKLLSVESRFSG